MDTKEISLLDLILVVAENLWFLILGPIFVVIIVLAHSLTIEPTYRAKTVIIPPSQPQSGALVILTSLGYSGGSPSVAGALSQTELYANILNSRVLRDALIDRLNILEKLKTSSRESAHRFLEGSVLFDKRKDGLFGIEFIDKDPEFAARISNAYVDELKRQLYRLHVEEAQRRKSFFDMKLELAADRLNSSEKALGSSGLNPSVLNINGSAVILTAKLNNLIADQEIKISSMKGYLSNSSSEVKQAIVDLSVLRNQLKNSEKEISKSDTAGQGSEFFTKLRNYKESEFQFNYLQRQAQVVGIEVAWEGSGIQVLDIAEKPDMGNSKLNSPLIIKTLFASEIFIMLILLTYKIIRFHNSNDFNAKKITSIKEKFRDIFYFHGGWKNG